MTAIEEAETMNAEDPEIEEWLKEVLVSILCPVAGCWFMHGCNHVYCYDSNCESHVLEVWPVGVEESDEDNGNGRHRTDQHLLYEFAEFDFMSLHEIPLQHFHFSQQRQIFEIGWKENGQDLELRVHIVPQEVDEDDIGGE